MYVSALMNLINLVGNAVLIFGFHMGVEGVAIPTLVSRAVAAVVILILLYRPGLSLQIERVTWKHDPYVVKNILRFGVPNGMESSMFQLGKILLLSTVSVLGTAAVAANAVGNMVATFQCIPGLAIGFAMVTVVSRCVGAGDYEKARFYTKKLMKYTYVMMGIAILVSLVGLPWILQLYKVSEEAEACASQLVWLHGVLGAVFWPLSFTLPQALRAAGDTRYTMVGGTVSMWTLRVGLGILMGRYWGLGVLGVWIAMCIDWLLRVTLFVVRFKGHKWETMGIKD
jgi:putative MATE family efflux protein